MNATDKLKTGSEQVEPRMYEPSMEEILASIRRIIADDHTLPGRSLERDGETNLRAALEGAQSRSERTAGFPAPQDKPTFLRGTSDSAAVYRHPAAPQAVAPRAEAVTPVPTPPVQAAILQPAPQPQTTPQPQGRIAAPQFAMPDAPVSRPPEGQLVTYAEAPAPEPAYRAPVAEASVPPQPVEQQAALEAGAAPALLSDATAKSVLEAFSRLTASRLADRDALIQDMMSDLLRPMLKGWLDEHLPALVERLVQAEIERLHGGR